MKTFVFDIDGTICTTDGLSYEKSEPIKDRIDKVNELHSSGNTIIMCTARGMGRNDNDPVKAHDQFYDFTKKQLDSWGVKYDLLILGKPAGDIYIDDKGKSDVEFFAD